MSGFTSGRETGRRRPRGYADWQPQASTRVLLEQVSGVLDEYRDQLPLTVRQIFYALVGREAIGKTEREYARLCEHMVRARRARLVPFGAIRDDRVSGLQAECYEGIEDFYDGEARRKRAYRLDRQAGQPVRLELWCEAAGMIPQLHRVAAPYTVPVFSAGGFVPLTGTRGLANRALDCDVPLVVLHVGDLDPSGQSIFDAMTEDASAFVTADRVLATQELRGVRVALTPEQAAEHELPDAPAKPSDSRSRSWQGGTCQLEALPPDVLAGIVRDAIEGQLDADVLGDVLQREHMDRAALLALPPGGAA